MADYKLSTNDIVIRTTDQANIPPDPANRDRAEYDKWLAAGGVPDPYVPPAPIVPQATVEMTVMYDHENRLRTIEGQPPMALGDFLTKLKGG